MEFAEYMVQVKAILGGSLILNYPLYFKDFEANETAQQCASNAKTYWELEIYKGFSK